MTRKTIVAVCCAALLLLVAPVAAQTFPITIDATALDAPDGYVIAGVGQFNTDTIDVLNLQPGFYSLFPFSTGFQLIFTVDAAGNVSYDLGLESIVDGAGTPTLTIVGFAMTIDVSPLSYSRIDLVRAAATLDLTGPNNLRLLPGFYLLGVPGAPPGLQAFGIDDAGKITYDPALMWAVN